MNATTKKENWLIRDYLRSLSVYELMEYHGTQLTDMIQDIMDNVNEDNEDRAIILADALKWQQHIDEKIADKAVDDILTGKDI